MFCPQCKIEYRPGFSHCNDCDVDLVEELPGDDAEESDAEAAAGAPADWRPAWAGNDEGECAAVGDRLQETEIPFQVVEQPEDFFFGGSGQHFEIRVPPESLAAARQTVQEIAKEIAEGAFPRVDDDESTEGVPRDVANEDVSEDPGEKLEWSEEEDDSANPAGTKLRWDPRNWHPEDATEEVWAGSDQPQANMVEMSLREHRIHSRTDTLDDGGWQIFVLPEQRQRARAIVREIVEGAPGR